MVLVASALLRIVLRAMAVRKWTHRTEHLKGIRLHESKLWRIKRPNEHGLGRRAEAVVKAARRS